MQNPLARLAQNVAGHRRQLHPIALQQLLYTVRQPVPLLHQRYPHPQQFPQLPNIHRRHTAGIQPPILQKLRDPSAVADYIRAVIDARKVPDLVSVVALMGGIGLFASTRLGGAIDSAILSSDLGQANNPLHPDGLETIFAGLRGAGMTIDEINRIAKRNPARLLGLE